MHHIVTITVPTVPNQTWYVSAGLWHRKAFPHLQPWVSQSSVPYRSCVILVVDWALKTQSTPLSNWCNAGNSGKTVQGQLYNTGDCFSTQGVKAIDQYTYLVQCMHGLSHATYTGHDSHTTSITCLWHHNNELFRGKWKYCTLPESGFEHMTTRQKQSSIWRIVFAKSDQISTMASKSEHSSGVTQSWPLSNVQASEV